MAETLGFTEVDMISKVSRRNGSAWLFEGRRFDFLSCCQTKVEGYDIEVVKQAKGKMVAKRTWRLGEDCA